MAEKKYFNRIFFSNGIDVNKLVKKAENYADSYIKDKDNRILILKDKKLFYMEERINIVERIVFPKYYIKHTIMTEKAAKNFDEETQKKYVHMPILLISEIKDDSIMIDLLRKYIKNLSLNEIAEALRIIRLNQLKNENEGNSYYPYELYRLMKYIPELENEYKNDKNLSKAVEDIAKDDTDEIVKANYSLLTIELANWILME